ncbi:MAG: recombination mediator RecR [Elusimicrobia bacterium]|nr:recombination mediator RecR [Candidatus Obscuribacterium magneticum]
MTQRWSNLVAALRKLPGVGPKMAERMALYLLRSDDTAQFVKAVEDAKTYLRRCSLCGNFTENDPCRLCADGQRDKQLLCVVEEVADLDAVERSGAFKGHYHLLGGVLSPLDGIGPKELRIDSLLKRLKENAPIEEIILATNPTVEGEATATYLTQIIKPLGKKVSRLAYGLPSGVQLEYADELTLSRAIEGRTLLAGK